MLEIVNVYMRPSDGLWEAVVRCPACGFYEKESATGLEMAYAFICPHCKRSIRVPPLHMQQQTSS